jgi:hypothetical protein
MEPYDVSELKLRKPGEVLREIPDSYYSKRFIPLCENLFLALRLSDSWGDYIGEGDRDMETFEESMVRGIQTRMNESFEISKAVEEGKIPKERQKQSVCYWGYPPLLPIRMDMQSLSTTMIYGPSVDISFVCLSDTDREVFFIFDLHVEESVPQTEDGLWFLLKSENPEIFNRRHMKLGIRLADLGKKIKSNIEVARRIREILIDIRNERTPQWSNSAYYVAFYFMAGVSNSTLEFSSYNSLGIIWDGCNATERYGLENAIYNYEPLPPILQMMFALERPLWLDRLTNALLGGQLYLNHVERQTLESIKKRDYSVYDIYMRYFSWKLHQGIVLPSQTVQAKTPVYNMETGEWDRTSFEYPEGPRIHYEDLGLTFDDMLNGVLLDLTHKSKVEKVTADNIISIGHGLETNYRRPLKTEK